MTARILPSGAGMVIVFHNPADLDRLIKRLTDLKASMKPPDFSVYIWDAKDDATPEQITDAKLVALSICAEVKKMQ